MEYQKYLKYKTKYLQLKAKLTQLGGAFRWEIVDKANKANKSINDADSALIQQHYLAGNNNIFSLRQNDYRYKLNIGRGTGVRINNLNQEIAIKQTDLATLEEFLEKQSTDFPRAFAEIQAGKKTGHWIWWILPSEIGESENAVKYALGPTAELNGSIAIATYLRNDTLRKNYLSIIRAIYDHLKKNIYMSKDPKTILKELLKSDKDIDYVKFKNSFKNFYPELKKIVNTATQEWLDDLHKILNPGVSASTAFLPPPGGHAAPLSVSATFLPPPAVYSDPLSSYSMPPGGHVASLPAHIASAAFSPPGGHADAQDIPSIIVFSKKNERIDCNLWQDITLHNSTHLIKDPKNDKDFVLDGSSLFMALEGAKGKITKIQTNKGVTYGKISIAKDPKVKSGFIEGWVGIEKLKKNWRCPLPHPICEKFSYNTPSSVVIILRSAGRILVATETNKDIKGLYHLCAGKIDPGKCPIVSCYDETAEESRLLPVTRVWDKWNIMFKPKGKYIIEPWLSETGKAVVFVGDAGKEYWDASNKESGVSQSFTNEKQLTDTFAALNKGIDPKYREKIHFKWVVPPPKGSTPQIWDDWAQIHKIYGWARDLIREYVEKLP